MEAQFETDPLVPPRFMAVPSKSQDVIDLVARSHKIFELQSRCLTAAEIEHLECNGNTVTHSNWDTIRVFNAGPGTRLPHIRQCHFDGDVWIEATKYEPLSSRFHSFLIVFCASIT